MKRFKLMAASVALLIGASGAAFAQRADHNIENSNRQYSYRVPATAPARNYEAARNDNDRNWTYRNGPYAKNEANTVARYDHDRYDNDDVMTYNYGRYTANTSRDRDHDGDDWQNTARTNDRRDRDHDRNLRSGVRQIDHGRNDRTRTDRDH